MVLVSLKCLLVNPFNCQTDARKSHFTQSLAEASFFLSKHPFFLDCTEETTDAPHVSFLVVFEKCQFCVALSLEWNFFSLRRSFTWIFLPADAANIDKDV